MLKLGFASLTTLLICIGLTIGGWFIAPPVVADSASPSVTTMARKPLFSFSGKRPTILGVKDGQLSACPNTPNCVSSQASDPEHQVAPIAFSGSAADAIVKLKAVVQGMERTEIISESPDYLYAEFTSALMGFVDDVEFAVDQSAGVIHVRSASRLGQSDLGVNRQRVEAIRAQFS